MRHSGLDVGDEQRNAQQQSRPVDNVVPIPQYLTRATGSFARIPQGIRRARSQFGVVFARNHAGCAGEVVDEVQDEGLRPRPSEIAQRI